jgi:transcriptional regulator with XRE-family HTH domain
MKDHGQRIRINRVLRGLSQFELAQRAGCSFSLVSLVERGHQPKAENLKRIERALGLDDDEESDE